MRLREIFEEGGVGRITKQNQTVDVGPNEIKKQAAKFGNTVDKDGRPPTLSKKVKGKSTNVLYNLGLAESKSFAEALGEIASATEIYVDMDGVLADFFGDWAKLMGVDSFRDIKDVEAGLQKIKDTKDFWLNLPVTDNAKPLLELIRKVKGEYSICSSPLPGDPNSEPHKREWIKKHLSFFPPKEIIITHDKAKYATQPDGTPNILIDDYGVNIAKWEAAGGIGFKHKDHKFERTAKAIKQHMQEPVEESSSCPRTKASKCQCESVNKITEAEETITAVCVLEHSDTVKGTILFKQKANGPTLIVGKITGLKPGEHGFHIHEFGDLSNGCESAGGHYNPDGVDHGDLEEGHVGDLGNVIANDNGTADIKIVAKRVDLVGERSVVGRAIVIHSDVDDLGKGGDDESLKTGNAGDRLACGVITLKETINEKWSAKYKRSINCSNPKGFSQKAHCAGRKKNEDIELDEGIIDSIVDFLKPYIERAQEKIKKLRGAVKQEYMETDLMWEILQKGDKARPFEIEFANNQFKDVLKGVGLGAWLALPIPGNTLWITLLEKLLNKFDISIMPDEVKRQVFNSMYENFADGKVKGKSRPGRVKRSGASCNGSVTDLRKRAKNSSGEKAKMYHWCANMKSGKKK